MNNQSDITSVPRLAAAHLQVVATCGVFAAVLSNGTPRPHPFLAAGLAAAIELEGLEATGVCQAYQRHQVGVQLSGM